jgi:hypothetical protein
VKLLALAELIPLVLMGAAGQTPPGCVEQRPANEASVTGASGTLEDLSHYSPEELDIYQARCDQELKAAIDRGDNAGAQSWARLRAAVIVEKQARLQILAPPTPNSIVSPTPHKTGTRRHRYHRPARKSTPRPTEESTPQPTPEEFPLPPGWPVGPKE